LIDEGRAEEAFGYAEKARAFEPTTLIRQRGNAPQAFTRVAQSDEKTRLVAIQRDLPANTYVIQYSVLGDRTYVWIISRNNFRPMTLQATRGDIERWAAALQEAAKQNSTVAFEGALRAPYDQLVREPIQQVKRYNGGRSGARVVFVPDGAMHVIPFAALRGSDRSPYLIQDWTVSIAPSSTLYIYSLLRAAALTNGREPSVLLVGDPTFDAGSAEGGGRSPLGGARTEVETIGKMYGASATLRIGEEATVPEFLRLARDKNIVHFAGHSVANAEVPSRSYLLLAKSPGRTGALSAQELLTDLTLNKTQLVILSSCSSAGSVTVGPEGMGPLVRPLMAAGVPAVIGSLWPVDDATAEQLLVSFHRHYLQGRDTAAALQTAQVKLLNEHQPALTWGAFQVIGYTPSPFTPGRRP
jgi:CHAT domain-containing protein